MPDQDKTLREAGCFEQYFHTRGRIGSNTYIVVSARYEGTSGSLLSKSVLFAALENVIRSNAALTARVTVVPPSPPTWVRLPAIDLKKTVSYVDKDSADLPNVLEELFGHRIDYSEGVPMWKLLVLRDGMIVFAYDHTMGDGQSGLAFHHALLKALNSSQQSSAEHSGIVTALPQDTVLAPALEDAIDVSVPFMTILREVAQAIFPSIRPKHPNAWTANPVLEALTMDTTVRIIHLNPADATKLVKLSRDHKTTLTGTLHTLALLVVSRLLRAQPGGDRFETMPTSIPISLRRYTNTPPTAFCNHVSSHQNHHPLVHQDASVSPDAFPWDTAAALAETLRREAPHSAWRVGLLKYLYGKYEEYLLGQLGRTRAAALELSNLGAFPRLDTTGEWRIKETLFAQADATIGAALKLNTVGAPEGGVGITVTWGKGAVDHEFAEAFVREFEVGLRAMVAPS